MEGRSLDDAQAAGGRSPEVERRRQEEAEVHSLVVDGHNLEAVVHNQVAVHIQAVAVHSPVGALHSLVVVDVEAHILVVVARSREVEPHRQEAAHSSDVELELELEPYSAPERGCALPHSLELLHKLAALAVVERNSQPEADGLEAVRPLQAVPPESEAVPPRQRLLPLLCASSCGGDAPMEWLALKKQLVETAPPQQELSVAKDCAGVAAVAAGPQVVAHQKCIPCSGRSSSQQHDLANPTCAPVACHLWGKNPSQTKTSSSRFCRGRTPPRCGPSSTIHAASDPKHEPHERQAATSITIP